MKFFLSGTLILFCLGSLSAQTFIGKINPFPAGNNESFADDTLRILAVMVSFPADRDGSTFGNGKFGTIYSQNYGDQILDPLPHNQSYFEDHLTFVQNYFTKVSKGKLFIEYTVLPDTFSVSQAMRNYSPPSNSNDFTPIGNFSVEAWTIADQLYPGFPFSSYDMFVIFHAGVGRDVSLPGSIGGERDLPSLYLNDKAFKEIYGETYEGIPVSGGSFHISNTAILPETESREVETISGTVLFEITTNGLICAMIGSHLGLPDLFDTNTGLSAIGRFGLMDGQSIFAYLGIFPPEPSPWEKLQLGWAEQVTIDISGGNVNLVTNITATLADTVILKVPLNSSEYYLIENRIRDANKNGSIVTHKVGGNIITQTFEKDTTGFQSYDVGAIQGVVLDVDEFDWAVPGNGIVIWHIDENIIAEKIDDNAINTDKNRRGVDIEEADGVQDIGEVFITIFGDQVIGEGTEEDFWHSSNPAELFTNRFAKDTRPNTLTNTGANSLITIKDFSEIDNRMSFIVEFGDSVVKPLFSYQFGSIPKHLSSIQFNDNTYLLINGDSLFNVTDGDSLYYQTSDFSRFKPVTMVDEDNDLFVLGGNLSYLNYWITDGITEFSGQVTIPSLISTPLVINKSLTNGNEVWFGALNGKIYKYTIGAFPNTAPALKDSILIGSEYVPVKIAVFEDYYSSISLHTGLPCCRILFTSSDGSITIDDDFPVEELTTGLALTKDADGNYVSVVLTQRGIFRIVSNSEIINSFNSTSQPASTSFSISDLKRDGNNHITTNSGSDILAYNFNGSLSDNFPASYQNELASNITPISIDFEGDENSEIISISKNGNIYAVDGGTGKLVTGFPISIGDSSTATPSIFNFGGKTNLVAANATGLVKVWTIGSVESDLGWKEEFANNENSSFIPAAQHTNRINEFFPSSRAYNYPNPVYEGSTNIRYFVDRDAHINIKIFDLAGDFVAELNDEAQGGMDNETVWNVGDVQSGVYLARIEAVCDCGNVEQAVIKIAVVK